MGDERSRVAWGQERGEPGAGLRTLLASSVVDPEHGRVVVFLAVQPDARRQGAYVLEAVLVPERPLRGSVRLVAHWEGGRRTARVDGAGVARIRGIPAAALQALQDGSPQALRLQIESVTGENNALA